MAGVKIVDRDAGYKKLMLKLKQLGVDSRQLLTVGIQGDNASQAKASKDSEPSGITNVQVAAVHEFGSADGKIPQRSFIRATFDIKRPEYLVDMRKIIDNVAFKNGNFKGRLMLFGEKVRKHMIQRIRAGIPPPLTPATIARKGGIETPLFHTGQLINSIDAQVHLP